MQGMQRTKNYRILGQVLLLLFGVVVSCKQIKPEAPERSKLDSTLVAPMASLNIPITYHLDSLEKWINLKVQKEFVNHATKVNKAGDSLYIQVEKLRDIRLSLHGNKIRYQFPVRVKGSYVKYFAGMRLSNNEPVETDMTLILSSSVRLLPDWKLAFNTRMDTILWEKEPMLRLGRLAEINLKNPLEQALYDQQDSLLKQLDRQAYEHLNIEEVIQKIWTDIQNPIYLHQQEPKVYLKIQAQDVSAALRFPDSKTLLFDVALNCTAVSSMDQKDLPVSMEVLPRLQPLKESSDSSLLVIKGIASFKKINEELEKELVGKEFEKSGYKVTIEDAEAYATGQSLAVQLDVKGSIKGRIYLVGKPVFDIENLRFKITDFRYDLDTESQLVSTANAIFKENILEEVSSLLYFDLSEQLTQVPGLITDALEKGKVGERIGLNIESLDIAGWNILLTKKDIQFVLKARAKAGIQLKNLGDRKPLQLGSQLIP